MIMADGAAVASQVHCLVPHHASPHRKPGTPLQRLVITRILIGAFRAVIASTPGDLLPMIYLCTNRVAPAHVGLELGIGDATLIKVCEVACVTLDWRRRAGARDLVHLLCSLSEPEAAHVCTWVASPPYRR